LNIPKIPTHTRQITPSGRVGAVEMPYDIARTGEGIIGAGLQQAGGALFELGLRKQQIRVDREFTQGKLLLAKADRESLEELRRDSTFRNVKADYVYVDQAGRQIKGIPGYFQNWIREKSRTRADIIEKIASSNQSKDALNEYLAFSEESFRSDANRMAWMKEKDYSRSSAFTAADEFERMGNATAAETLIRRAMENEYVGLEEGEKRIGLIKHNIDWYVGEAMANGSPKEFLDKINNKNFLPNLNPSEKLRLSKQANRQLDNLGSEANKQLTDLLAAGTLSIGEIQKRRDVLSDTDYTTWTKIALNPPDKIGNIIQATGLKSAAMDVWRGTITREELDKRIRISLANPEGINNEQYADIISSADRELKSTQAEDIRRFSRNAANVILGQYSGLLQFDALGNLTGVNLAGLSGDEVEDAKYRMHFLSLYEQGLRDWIAENPKASGKEFYQYAAEQKMRYWNTTLESMKLIAQRQGRQIKGAVPTAEELRRQNTKEAYNKGVELGYWK